MVRRDLSRLRGLFSLAVDATIGGSRAIEKIQVDKARIPFHVLEAVPIIAAPVKVVHVAYDFGVAATHASIRAVAGGVGEVATLVLDTVEQKSAPADGGDGARAPDGP